MNDFLNNFPCPQYRKKKVKALYGSWAKELYALNPEDYEDFMKELNSGTSPSHHAKVCTSRFSPKQIAERKHSCQTIKRVLLVILQKNDKNIQI